MGEATLGALRSCRAGRSFGSGGEERGENGPRRWHASRHGSSHAPLWLCGVAAWFGLWLATVGALRSCRAGRSFGSGGEERGENGPRRWQASRHGSSLAPLWLCGVAAKPPMGFEPTTCALRKRCSTAELGWQGAGSIHEIRDAVVGKVDACGGSEDERAPRPRGWRSPNFHANQRMDAGYGAVGAPCAREIADSGLPWSKKPRWAAGFAQ